MVTVLTMLGSCPPSTALLMTMTPLTLNLMVVKPLGLCGQSLGRVLLMALSKARCRASRSEHLLSLGLITSCSVLTVIVTGAACGEARLIGTLWSRATIQMMI